MKSFVRIIYSVPIVLALFAGCSSNSPTPTAPTKWTTSFRRILSSDSSVDLGTSFTNETAIDTLWVRNAGVDTIHIRSWINKSVDIFKVYDFYAPRTIPPNGAAFFLFYFSPTDTLEHYDTVHFLTSDIDSGVTSIAIRTRSILPYVMTRLIDFGTVTVGREIDTFIFIRNLSHKAIGSASAYTYQPSRTSSFFFPLHQWPWTAQPGDSVHIHVGYKPRSAGLDSAVYGFNDRNNNPDYRFVLRGTGQ